MPCCWRRGRHPPGRAGHPELTTTTISPRRSTPRRGGPGPGQLRLRVATGRGRHAAAGGGSQVWVMVNEPSEVEWADALGVDGLVVPGWRRGPPWRAVDAGGVSSEPCPLGLRGGSAHGPAGDGSWRGDDRSDAADVLRAGATAVALGTAFLDCPEPARRRPPPRARPTATAPWSPARFTGRSPAPHHHVDRAVRRAAPGMPARGPRHGAAADARQGDREAELVHLRAGTGHSRLGPCPPPSWPTVAGRALLRDEGLIALVPS